MGSCLSSKNYSHNYYDNRHYNSYHTSTIENRILEFPAMDSWLSMSDKELRKKAEKYAASIENHRIQQNFQCVMNQEIKSLVAPAKTYEELRKQVEIELGYADPARDIFENFCNCKSFHMIYRRGRKHGEKKWEIMGIIEENREDCQMMLDYDLCNTKFHRIYLENDGYIHT